MIASATHTRGILDSILSLATFSLYKREQVRGDIDDLAPMAGMLVVQDSGSVSKEWHEWVGHSA